MRKLLILLALVGLIFGVTYADSSSSGEESTPPRYIAFFDDGQDDEDWDEDEEDWDEDEEHEDDESFDDAQEDWDWEDEDSDEEDDEFEDEFDGEDYSFDDAHDEEDDYEFDLEVEKEELPEWIEELRDEDLSEEQLAALDVIAAQIDSVDNEDQFFDLIDELIEIEEEVFGFEDIYEDDWEDFEVDEEFIAEVVKEYEDIAGITGLDLGTEIARLASFEGEDYDELDEIFELLDEKIGEDNVDVEKYYTDMWIAELDEIFIEEELATELDELANIQTKYASAETFADLEEIHTLLVLLEEDVFNEIDFDEEDFTVDEGKVWAQEWIDEVIEYLTETEGNQQDIDDLEAARLLVDAATSYDELFEAEDAIIEVEERLDWESFDDTQDEEYDFDEEKAFALEALDAIIDMAQADDETDLVVALTDIRATVSAATDFDGLEDAEDEFWELEDQVGDYVDQFFIAYEEDYEDDDEYPDDLTTDDLQDWTEYVDEFLGDLEDYDLDVANLQESIDTLQNKIANASDEDVDTIAQGLVGIEESINQLLEELDA